MMVVDHVERMIKYDRDFGKISTIFHQNAPNYGVVVINFNFKAHTTRIKF